MSEPNMYRTRDGKKWWIEFEGTEYGPYDSADESLAGLSRLQEKKQEEADHRRELKEGK